MRRWQVPPPGTWMSISMERDALLGTYSRLASPPFRCAALPAMDLKPCGREDRYGDDPRSESGRGNRPHRLHVVSAVRETDGCRRDADDNKPENETADEGDPPTIAEYHEGRSQPKRRRK